MRFKQYLKEQLILEKTFNISKDVTFLFNKSFKDTFNLFKKYKYDLENDKLINSLRKIGYPNTTLLYSTTSKDLKTKDAAMAHKANPAIIEIGLFPDGSLYRPRDAYRKIAGVDMSFIQISLHAQAFEIIMKKQFSKVPMHQRERFMREIAPERAKASIAHELSHWISDTVHNHHISKLINKAMEYGDDTVLKLGKGDINLTYFEMDAFIHSIKQLKKSHLKNWNNLTLIDLFNMYTTLIGIAHKAVTTNTFKEWQKKLIKRLSREGLLGKNMKPVKETDVKKSFTGKTD